MTYRRMHFGRMQVIVSWTTGSAVPPIGQPKNFSVDRRLTNLLEMIAIWADP
jgi:hypothetical protein